MGRLILKYLLKRIKILKKSPWRGPSWWLVPWCAEARGWSSDAVATKLDLQ
jgi:hypothetical protein